MTKISEKIIKKIKSGAYTGHYNHALRTNRPESRRILIQCECRGGKLSGEILALLEAVRREKPDPRAEIFLAVPKGMEKNIKAGEGIRIIGTGSRQYDICAAGCGFLICDGSLLPYVVKRKHQVCLNLWTEDCSVCPEEAGSEGRYPWRFGCENRFRNLVIADYIWFPDPETEQRITESWHLAGICRGRILKGYDLLKDPEAGARLWRELLRKEKAPCCEIPGGNPSSGENRKQNILLYGGSLERNGITSAFLELLKVLDRDKYNFYVSYRTFSLKDHPEILQEIPEGYGFFPLASEMNMDAGSTVLQGMYLKGGRRGPVLMKELRRAYRIEWRKHFGDVRFDHIVHFSGYEDYLLQLFRYAPCKKTIWAHSDMLQEIRLRKTPSLPALRDAYRSFDHVAAVSEAAYASAKEIAGEAGDQKGTDHIRIIGNLIDEDSIRRRSLEPLHFEQATSSNVTEERLGEILDSDALKFVSMGRFSGEKNHHALIEGFDLFYEKHPESELILIGGSGPLYEDTLKWASDAKAAGHIAVIRNIRNPMPVLKKCSLFLLPSQYEGQPMVLLEAAALDLPVAAADTTGCREMIGKYGGHLLENTPEGICRELCRAAEGDLSLMKVDFPKRRKEILQEIENLFEKTGTN